MHSPEFAIISTMAKEMAENMNSNAIAPPHYIAAALSLKSVEVAMQKSGIDVVKLKEEIRKDCEGVQKVPETSMNSYKKSKIKRQIRPSLDAQRFLLNAESLSESEAAWQTGWTEVSHMFASVIEMMYSKTLNGFLINEKDKNNKVLNTFLNELAHGEATRRGKTITPISITGSVSNAISQMKGQKMVVGYNNHSNESVCENEEDLTPYCKNLLKSSAMDDKPFIGRDEELNSLIQCLERRDKPNAILAGPPGVGKTDIIRGLAKKIKEGNVPDQLKDIELFSVDIAGMLAGSEYRGAFEKRLKETIEAACEKDRPILFIDEIHMVMGAGKTVDSSMDAANILKPYLTERKIRVIGATTPDEYRKYIEKDSAFMRRFQKIDVSEPSPSDAVKIIEGVKSSYESFHKIKINKNAIKAAVDLSVKHMHDKYLPDKAIDILDQTCARVKLENTKKVTEQEIETTVANLCHIPAKTIQKDEMELVRKLDTCLKSQVFGQDEAIETLVKAVQMSKAGLNDENKPIGTFLFVGPSGVGKTEASKKLAENLGIHFLRFDMSEYAEPHTVAKLIGSPAGYVGYEDGGLLVEKVREHPNSVVLFDEIEKAHPDVYKTFLQIFDYGMLTDNKGRKADFRNTIIIMTSNAGNAECERARIGFGEKTETDRKTTSMKAIETLMAPELRGRISATVVFSPLTKEVSRMIVKKELKSLYAKLSAKGTKASCSDEAIDEIVKRGVSAQYGAREIKRVIENDIKTLFVKSILSGKNPEAVLVEFKDNQFILKPVAKKMSSKKAEIITEE